MQEGSIAAIQEGVHWQQNAAAFMSRAEATFPMYRDLTHPVKQAVLELQHGLTLLANSACPDQSGWVNLAGHLAEFPARQGASSYCRAQNRMHGLKQDFPSAFAGAFIALEPFGLDAPTFTTLD